jgi:NTP pyrophosphatase (non-canonical NTP hydrolase)
VNREEHLIACLAEECGEVAKECMKALRFGLDDKVTRDPNGPRGTEGPTNAEKIAAELCDLFAVAEMLTDKGIIPQKWYAEKDVNNTKRKVLAYMGYAERVGALRKETA